MKKRNLKFVIALAFSLWNVSASELELSEVLIPIAQKELTQNDLLICDALVLFDKEFENAIPYLKYWWQEVVFHHPAIEDSHSFYMSMVLVHVKMENYVKSFLEEKINIYKLLGLATAFEAHRSSIRDTAGFTDINNHFLTDILTRYRAKTYSLIKNEKKNPPEKKIENKYQMRR